MPIVAASGDPFANMHHARALAHGCNCQGSMGDRVFADSPGTLYVYEHYASATQPAANGE